MAGRGDNNRHGSAGRGASNQSNQALSEAPEYNVGEIGTDSVGPEKTFDMLVDKVPYQVKVSSFNFNDEPRYYISINGSPRHVFTWDPAVSALRAIDDDAADIPSPVEEEISRRLVAGVI